MSAQSTFDTIVESTKGGAETLLEHLPVERVTEIDWREIELPDMPDLSLPDLGGVGESVVEVAGKGRRFGIRSGRTAVRSVREHPKVSGATILAIVTIIAAVWYIRRGRNDGVEQQDLKLAGVA